MDINFEHNGKRYIATFQSSALRVGTVGCHSVILTQLGTMSFAGLKSYNGGILQTIPVTYDPWGNWASGPMQILQERFKDKTEELKDFLYTSLATEYYGNGVVIFSDHVNGDTSQKPVSEQKVIGESFSTAAFAKWLHKNRAIHGPVYGSPICGNPLHSQPGNYSLVQVFTWVPKTNAWSIISDVGDIPCPVDPEYTADKFFKSGRVSRLFDNATPEQLKKLLKVTYA